VASLIGRFRSISGLSPLFTGGLTLGYLLTDPTTVGFFSRDLTAQIGSYLCILPRLPGRGKINGPDTPMDLGDLRSRFLRYPRRHRKQRGKAFNTLLTPTNLTVMCDHRFPDGISSVDQYLSGLRHLTLPSSSSDLTVVSDHRSPDGISSVDSILHPYAAISGFQEDRSSSCRVTKALRLHILFPGS
jgi:hypothetical protein